MSLKDTLKNWRYRKVEHVLKGYKIDKLIFNIYWIVVLIVGLYFIVYVDKLDFSTKIGVNCKGDYCLNPFYTAEYNQTFLDLNYEGGFNNVPQEIKDKCVFDWCSQKWLDNGIYGENPEEFNNQFNILKWLSILGLILALLINHFIHNKNYEFKEVGLDENDNNRSNN